MPNVLFLCSGNYYRSRFAEILFNHLAAQAQTSWHADSAGLRVRPDSANVGPISLFAVAGLGARDIPLPRERMPRQVTQEELASADLIIALKEAEHRAMMRASFPAWEDRIRYWHVHDLDAATPDQALPELERLVRALHTELHAAPSATIGSNP